MKIYFFIVLLVITVAQRVLAQKNIYPSNHQQEEKGMYMNDFPDFDHNLLLETTSDTTANVSFGDFDGDGHLDILLVKGRHWPIVDRVLLGDGLGRIRKGYDLGRISDRSYTGGLADFNGYGFLDIAVSNDAPDRKLIYFNDGEGNFKIGSEFGLPEWPTRNLSIADINADGLPDLILANRGDLGKTSNYICLNTGKGQFSANCIPFALTLPRPYSLQTLIRMVLLTLLYRIATVVRVMYTWAAQIWLFQTPIVFPSGHLMLQFVWQRRQILMEMVYLTL